MVFRNANYKYIHGDLIIHTSTYTVWFLKYKYTQKPNTRAMSDRYPSEQGLQYLLFVSICLSVLKAYTIWQSLSLPKIYCIYNTQLSILIIGIFQNVPFEFY